MYEPLHKNVRAALAARIAGGELQPGDRLPAERDLSAEFDVTRTVIRQALAGLARDGMIVSAYPRGYDVLGPRIPWLSRFRLLTDEPWDVEIIDTAMRPATPDRRQHLPHRPRRRGDHLPVRAARRDEPPDRGRSDSPPTPSTPSTTPPAPSCSTPDSSTTTNSNASPAAASSATTNASAPACPPPTSATASRSPPPRRSSRSPAPRAPPPHRSPGSHHRPNRPPRSRLPHRALSRPAADSDRSRERRALESIVKKPAASGDPATRRGRPWPRRVAG